MIVRAVDGGGDGFRRADIIGNEVKNMQTLPSAAVQNVKDLIDFACNNLLLKTAGIAYALAGVIEGHRIVVKSPNIPFLDGMDLVLITEKASDVKKTIVCNDMESSVTGMAELLPHCTNFMGITWSSGIGVRFWRNKEILAESEGGHIPLDLSPFAPLCGCGKRGCAEAVIGGLAIRRRVIAECEARKIEIPTGMDPCKFLDASFDKKERWAEEIYGMVADGMGAFLATICSLVRPPTVVWKGTFGICAINRIETSIRYAARKHLINPDWALKQTWEFSPQPETDGLIGAAAIFQKMNG